MAGGLPFPPFSGKTRQAAEFVQTFNQICPPEAKIGQNNSPFNRQFGRHPAA
jgi:hypothetical protein